MDGRDFAGSYSQAQSRQMQANFRNNSLNYLPVMGRQGQGRQHHGQDTGMQVRLRELKPLDDVRGQLLALSLKKQKKLFSTNHLKINFPKTTNPQSLAAQQPTDGHGPLEGLLPILVGWSLQKQTKLAITELY